MNSATEVLATAFQADDEGSIRFLNSRPRKHPINMTGAPKSETGVAHDRRSDRFSIPVFGVEPAGHAAVAIWNERELARERVRLWYVAATPARDLLVLPRHAATLADNSWARVVDLGFSSLPAISPRA